MALKPQELRAVREAAKAAGQPVTQAVVAAQTAARTVAPTPSAVGSASYVPSTAPSVPGTGDWLGSPKPRLPPTGPTKESAVTVVGGTPPAPAPVVPDFSTLTDQQKKDKIYIKRQKQEALSDDELLYERDNPAGYDKQDFSGIEAEYKTEAERLAAERQRQIAAKQAAQQAEFGIAKQRYEEAGKREGEAVQGALSFSGFGRSTYNADKQAMIQRDVSDRTALLQQQQGLELLAYQKEIAGADREALKPLFDRIQKIKDYNSQLEYNIAKNTQDLKFDQQKELAKRDAPVSKNEILQAQLKIPAGSTFEIDGKTYKGLGEKAVSALDVQKIVNDTPVGSSFSFNGQTYQGTKAATATSYTVIKDKNGNQYRYNKADNSVTLITDASGKAIQGMGVSMQLSYNPLTGEASIFNPQGGTSIAIDQQASAAANQSYEPAVSESANTSGMKVISTTDANRKNCVKYARTLVSGLPTMGGENDNGPTANAAKQRAVDQYGFTNPSQVKVGDAVVTGEGIYGHVAVVTSINNGIATLKESNFDSGKVTQGRTLSLNDSVIKGFIHPNASETKTGNEGTTPSVTQQQEGGGQSEQDVRSLLSQRDLDYKQTESAIAQWKKTGTVPSVGLKPLEGEAVKSFAKAKSARGDMDKISQLIDQLGSQGPVIGRFRSANPYDDKVVRFNNLVRQAVPGMARGIFGEVGVLTDEDVKLYTSIMASPNLTKAQAKQATVDLQSKINRSISDQISTYKDAQYNIGQIEKTEQKFQKNTPVQSQQGAPSGFGSSLNESQKKDLLKTLFQ